jgi:hypothetical protein
MLGIGLSSQLIRLGFALRGHGSDPNHVVLTVTDSNVWGGASGYTYTFKPQPNERTDVDVANVREGKNFKGRVLGVVLGTLGKGKPEKAFANTVKAIEARNYGARTAEQT